MLDFFKLFIEPISSFLSTRWLWVVLDGKSSQEYPVNAGVPQGFILGPTPFLLYINDLPDDVSCNIDIYADVASDLWQQLSYLLKFNLMYETLRTRVGSGLLISMLEILNWFHLTGIITLVLLM